MNEPWKKWIPGVLSKRQMEELIDGDYINNVVDKDGQLGHSALDLTLSDVCYSMESGSVKPFGDRYETHIKEQQLANVLEPDSEGIFTLKKKHTYLFKINETLHLRNTNIYGQATAKSTIGRMDVLARLIVDGMDEYEGFTSDAITNSTGNMYLEVTPITFDVRVKPGMSLSQLRFFKGNPEYSEIKGEGLYETVLHNSGDNKKDASLTVDLTNTVVAGNDACAFCAKSEKSNSPVELWKRGDYNPSDYWDILPHDGNLRFRIEKTNFYILRSKEMISLPGSVAVYCRAIDESIGEMRIHYAGFAHPFFGHERDDGQSGTPLIFEVRGHDVDVSLKDGEKMAKLIFYRMSEPSESDGEESYNDQILQLSKIFSPWSE